MEAYLFMILKPQSCEKMAIVSLFNSYIEFLAIATCNYTAIIRETRKINMNSNIK